MSRLQNLFRTDEVDPEARNRVLLITGIVAVVAFSLVLIGYGYYVDRIEPRNDTVFTVGERNFSYAYLEDRIDAAVAEGTFNTSNIQFGIAQMVSDIQNEELTRRIAAEAGITISGEELDTGMRADVGVPPDAGQNIFAAALRDHLQTLGLSLDRYEEKLEASLLEDKLTEQIASEQPAELEQVELNILVVDTNEAATAAKQRITDGEDFGEVAKEVSLHSSASNGGAIGWTPKELLSDDLAEPVFALQPDQVSDVIPTANGFYIVKVGGKETRPVDEGMRSNLARTEFGKRLEAASEEYTLENLVTVEQAQRIANHIQVPGG